MRWSDELIRYGLKRLQRQMAAHDEPRRHNERPIIFSIVQDSIREQCESVQWRCQKPFNGEFPRGFKFCERLYRSSAKLTSKTNSV